VRGSSGRRSGTRVRPAARCGLYAAGSPATPESSDYL
jgi:hypothetical protein